MTSKNWCLTWNNFDSEFDMTSCPKCTYIIWQHECGATRKTPHYQIYIQFETAVRMSHIQKWIPGIHCEAQKAKNNELARHYCMKPVSGCDCEKCEEEKAVPTVVVPFKEWGTFTPGIQGARSDIYSAAKRVREESYNRDDMDNDEELQPLIMKFPNYMNHQLDLVKKQDPVVEREFRATTLAEFNAFVIHFAKDPDVYYKPNLTKFWPGYDSQSTIAWRIRHDQIPQEYFEPGLLYVEYKGGHTILAAKQILVIDEKSQSVVWNANKS
nr:MAG: replication associated protein [Cressdnaviricota sp.]